MMIYEIEAQYMLCALVYACQDYKNEMDLSLYSLNSKTSRYAHFGDNRLTVYGIWLAAFMLPLHQKFKFQNIQHAAFHIRIAAFEIRIAAFEIRIAVYVPEAYCPKSSLSLVKSG